jgi:Protein of unknown function (DUF3054)
VAGHATGARSAARGLVTETVRTTPHRGALAIGDVVALLVFTLIGLANHKDGITASTVLKVIGPLVVVSALASVLFGTYRRPGMATLVPTWLVTVPIAILIRKVMFHTPTTWGSTGIFIGVALVFTLLFISVWRLVARYMLRWL